MEVLVLGPIEARADGASIALRSPAQRALLAALAHARGQAVPTWQLEAVVWGDDPPATAGSALKSHVSRLRRTLGADVIAARPPGYALTIAPERIDAHRFEQGLGAAGSVAEIDAALALWRGPPYGELSDHHHFAGDVARLVELHAQGLIDRAEHLRAAGQHDDAAAAYKGLVAEDPLREPAWIGLLQALQAAGRVADAAAEARRYREHAVEVGLEPSQRFVSVEREVFTAAPPPRETASARSLLPAPVSSVVGRERELEQIDGLLRARRLVTLVGPGGVGKTTLALQAAVAAQEGFADGAFVVTLADVDEPASVVPAIIRAVGAPGTEPLDRSLEGYLARRRALLVLDNAEHVHAAVRAVTGRLAAVAHELTVLTTSRQPLDVSGEAVLSIEPLTTDAAIQLFRERAGDAGVPIPVDQESLVAEMCDRLDRLPLAIEMAAARLRGMGLEDLAARLGDRLRLLRTGGEGRHDTLEAVVAWSYDLLDAPRRSLLDRLSVFAGPFDLDAAEAVGGVVDVAGGLADLVDRSLAHAAVGGGHARYHLLETVRTFAGERLGCSDARQPTIARYVRHYAALAERIAEGLRGPDEASWVDLLEAQTANLEAAHAHALQIGDVDAAVRIATAPFVFVYHRLRADIGAWAEATLPAARAAGHPGTPAVAALVALSSLNRGDFDGARSLLADLPDDPIARHAHEVLGDLHAYRGELDVSDGQFRRAEELACAADDRFTVMHARMSRAMVLGYAGRIDDGLDLVARVRREADDAGTAIVGAWCDYTEGELVAETQPRRALELVDRAVAAADEAGWRMVGGVGRLTASSLRARTADPADAVPGFERLIRHWDGVGDQTHQWTTLRNLVDLLIRLGAHAPAARLLGAVGTASRPTFGPERQRLQDASVSVRAHLGDDADALIQAGRADDLAAAIDVGLAALADLRSKGAAEQRS